MAANEVGFRILETRLFTTPRDSRKGTDFQSPGIPRLLRWHSVALEVAVELGDAWLPWHWAPTRRFQPITISPFCTFIRTEH